MFEWIIENQKLSFAIIVLLFGWIIWALHKTFAKKEELIALADRVTQMENTITDLPGIKEMHELDKSLIEVSGKLETIKPQLDNLQLITNILLENEIGGGKK